MKKLKIYQKIVKNCKNSSKLGIFEQNLCLKNTAWLSKGARGELEGTRGYSRVLEVTDVVVSNYINYIIQ